MPSRFITSIAIGLAAAALLLGVLGLARLLVVRVETPDLTLRTVELSDFELPPPPPPPSEPAPDLPPPPQPAITELSQLPDPSRVPIPRAEVPLDLSLPVETFFTDLAPPALPVPVAERPRPAPQPAAPRPAATPPRPAPPPPPPSHYQIGDLDSVPRLLRHGTAPFPPALSRRGVTSGTVELEVELAASGAVRRVRRVVSASHPELEAPARRIALSARFTPPTRQGNPVDAVMRWPITIRR